tara:strand:- start:2045 stop:2254 length:210 start_codon:yes stop_codon:yes gene_type:complete
MSILTPNKSNLKKEGVEKESYDGKFNIKEVSYLLNMIDAVPHDGKNLETALSCKTKLQDSLNILTRYKE